MIARVVERLFRHPRRLGFVAFNVAIVCLLVLTGRSGPAAPEASLLDLPNLVVGYVGTSFLLAAWALGWLAWTLMIVSRRRRLQRAAISGAPRPRYG